MRLEPFCDKWAAFGFHVLDIDGNNIKELCEAIDFAYENTTGKPVMNPISVLAEALDLEATAALNK